MQIGLSRVPWDEDSSVKDRRDAMLIQFVSMEPLSRNSIRATQKQDTVLSLVVKCLKPGIIPPRGDVKGGGRKLLSYLSQWRRTVWCLDVGNEVTSQVMYHRICLTERVSYTNFVYPARRSFSWPPWRVEDSRKVLLAKHAGGCLEPHWEVRSMC